MPAHNRSGACHQGQASSSLLVEAAQDLQKVSKQRTAWKPAQRAVLASMPGLTTEPPLIQSQSEHSCKAGLTTKLRQRQEKKKVLVFTSEPAELNQ